MTCKICNKQFTSSHENYNDKTFKRLTFDEIKNIETLKLIEEWLNLKK